MNKQQFEAIIKWQKETFTLATPLSKISHLEKEVFELKEAIEQKDIGLRHEIADCILLIFGTADALGMSYDDILNAIDEKFIINQKRKWGKPDENGVVYHIKNA